MLLALGSQGSGAEEVDPAPAADWPMYHRDLEGTRYSPLTGLDTENVHRLELAWTYRFNRRDRERIEGPRSFELYQQITPIVVEGVMYMPSGERVVGPVRTRLSLRSSAPPRIASENTAARTHT